MKQIISLSRKESENDGGLTEEQKKIKEQKNLQKRLTKRYISHFFYLQIRFSTVSFDDVYQKFQDQGIYISDLNLTKYKQLLTTNIQNTQSLIPAFPQIKLPPSQQKKQQTISQYFFREKRSVNRNPSKHLFISSSEIAFLTKNLIEHIQKHDSKDSQQRKTLFRNNTQNSFIQTRFASVNNSLHTSQGDILPNLFGKRNNSKLTDESHACFHDEVLLQLEHNKGQLLQNQNQVRQLVLEESIRIQEKMHFKKKQTLKIKQYPSKSLIVNQDQSRPISISNNQTYISKDINLRGRNEEKDQFEPFIPKLTYLPIPKQMKRQLQSQIKLLTQQEQIKIEQIQNEAQIFTQKTDQTQRNVDPEKKIYAGKKRKAKIFLRVSEFPVLSQLMSKVNL